MRPLIRSLGSIPISIAVLAGTVFASCQTPQDTVLNARPAEAKAAWPSNMLLVGDTGGLLDPITGEGIYAAIWSGQIAAQHLALYVAGEVPSLDPYRIQVERELLPDLQVSRQFHDVFHLSPRFYMALERRTSIIWRMACSQVQYSVWWSVR